MIMKGFIFIMILLTPLSIYAQSYITIENGIGQNIFSESEQNPGNLIIICFEKIYVYGCGGQYERLHIVDVNVIISNGKVVTVPEAVTIPYTMIGGGIQKRFYFSYLFVQPKIGVFIFDKTKPDLSQIIQIHGAVHIGVSIEDLEVRLGCHHWSDAHSAEGRTQEFCGVGIGLKF